MNRRFQMHPSSRYLFFRNSVKEESKIYRSDPEILSVSLLANPIK